MFNQFENLTNDDLMEVNGGGLPFVVGVALAGIIVVGGAIVIAATVVFVADVVQTGYNAIRK